MRSNGVQGSFLVGCSEDPTRLGMELPANKTCVLILWFIHLAPTRIVLFRLVPWQLLFNSSVSHLCSPRSCPFWVVICLLQGIPVGPDLRNWKLADTSGGGPSYDKVGQLPLEGSLTSFQTEPGRSHLCNTEVWAITCWDASCASPQP